ncbi:MAG: pyridoxal-dependent decarboxylase [Halioglobus sp.]
MFSRRKFLINTGVAAASGSVMCSPLASASPATTKQALLPATGSVVDAKAQQFIHAKRTWLKSHDPKVFLGYPGNKNPAPDGFIRWREQLATAEVYSRSMNNVGDPFYHQGHGDTQFLEADLIERFGQRYGFDGADIWGFVSNSGTDSNMHGAFVGRTLLKARTGVAPKIYYTTEAHYSIQVIRDLLSLEEVQVATTETGAMDIADLREKLDENKEAPVLMVATIGTTLMGAVDNIDEINAALKGRESYMHLDAALFGGYLHVTEHAADLHKQGPAGKRYDSIAVSCHKFFGYPGTAGMFIAGKKDFEEFRELFRSVHDPAYISHVPGTITCSRDSVKPAEFHYYCTAEALQDQERNASMVLANAQYLRGEMASHFPEFKPMIADSRSNTVYFDNLVSRELKKKWTLATVKASANHPKSMAHVVVMPHAEKSLLDKFLNDLEADRKGGALA